MRYGVEVRADVRLTCLGVPRACGCCASQFGQLSKYLAAQCLNVAVQGVELVVDCVQSVGEQRLVIAECKQRVDKRACGAARALQGLFVFVGDGCQVARVCGGPALHGGTGCCVEGSQFGNLHAEAVQRAHECV